MADAPVDPAEAERATAAAGAGAGRGAGRCNAEMMDGRSATDTSVCRAVTARGLRQRTRRGETNFSKRLEIEYLRSNLVLSCVLGAHAMLWADGNTVADPHHMLWSAGAGIGAGIGGRTIRHCA